MSSPALGSPPPVRPLLEEARGNSSLTVELIIPVFNEEDIVRKQLTDVLRDIPDGFTVSVIENGSTDGTISILRELGSEHPALSFISLPEPNYGLAMKTGILKATGDILLIDDLDVLDRDFWTRGLMILLEDEVELVQGSKVLAGKDDRRPFMRKAATRVLTFLLRTLLGYEGTDTHGPKVMKRKAIEGIPGRCQLELDIFPTEFVIRAQRAGVAIREIPIHLREIRATPLPLAKRVPRALRDIWRLHTTLKE